MRSSTTGITSRAGVQQFANGQRHCTNCAVCSWLMRSAAKRAMQRSDATGKVAAQTSAQQHNGQHFMNGRAQTCCTSNGTSCCKGCACIVARRIAHAAQRVTPRNDAVDTRKSPAKTGVVTGPGTLCSFASDKVTAGAHRQCDGRDEARRAMVIATRRHHPAAV